MVAQPKKRPATKSSDNGQPKARRGFKLISITMTMLALLFVVKVNELYFNSKQLREIYGVRDATAEEKAEEKPEAKAEHGDKEAEKSAENKDAKKESAEGEKSDAKKEDGKEAGHGEAKEGDEKAEGHGAEGESKEGDKKKDEAVPGVNRTYGIGRSKLEDIEALKTKAATPRFSQNEIDLLENLSKRRDELDQREKDLTVKSKVLEATEKRIGDKISEMKTLQVELSKVVAQYGEKQDTQIKSLVKIYENMKPSDAAKIFNEMDMPILLEVIDKMSERKVAPVLAAMSPQKARDVTQELAALRQSVTKTGSGAKP